MVPAASGPASVWTCRKVSDPKMFGHADRARPVAAVACRHADALGPEPDGGGTEFGRRRAADQVHLWRADEAGDEHVGRVAIQFQRRADLLDAAGVQHHDAVGQRHRLHLIVRDVDHGALKPLVQLADLQPHADPQRGIKVGQRLVEQERLWIAHDGAADGDALALATRQLAAAAGRDTAVRFSVLAAVVTFSSMIALGSFAILSGKAMLLRTVMCG